MKNSLQNIDSSTAFFFAVLMLFLGLRALPIGAKNISLEQKELNSEIFMPENLEVGFTCQEQKDFQTSNFKPSNIGYLP